MNTRRPSQTASNSAWVISAGRGEDGDCTSTLSSPALPRNMNPPSLSVAMAGRGLLGRRDHAVLRARALSPNSDATRNISGMPTGEPPEAVADLLGIGTDAEESQQRNEGDQAWIGRSDLPASCRHQSSHSTTAGTFILDLLGATKRWPRPEGPPHWRLP